MEVKVLNKIFDTIVLYIFCYINIIIPCNKLNCFFTINISFCHFSGPDNDSLAV